MTMSDSGPEPRSHSPLVLASSVEIHRIPCPLMGPHSMADRPGESACQLRLVGSACRFDLANLVAQLRGPLVLFVGDGFFHFAPQADQLRLLFGVARRTRLGTLPTCRVSP